VGCGGRGVRAVTSFLGNSGEEFVSVGPLAYRGKVGCQSVECTRRDIRAYLDGTEESCFGWHCAYCDEPCSSHGHQCPAAEAMLDASRRIAGEQA